MRKLHLFMFLIGVAGTLVAQSNDAPDVLAPAIDSYLNAKHTTQHPLAQHGAVFVSEGATYQVNPRFLVAITGGETGFGTHVCAANNAFNWFWDGACTNSPFDTWDSGIHTVAHFMQKSYILHGYTTIPTISKKYCTQGCENWITLIGQFDSDLGGDPDAPVLWNQAAETLPPISTLPPPTPLPPPFQGILTAKLSNVIRDGLPLSSNRTVSVTIQASAQNLGTLKPGVVSLLLDGTTGTEVVGVMVPGPSSADGKTLTYSGSLVLPESQLNGKTIGVEMTLSGDSSTKTPPTLRAADLTLPASSDTALYVVLGSVVALLLLGMLFVIVRAFAGRRTQATTANRVMSK